MIVITGAAGFIGSCLVSQFNNLGRSDLILVDHINKKNSPNLAGKKYVEYIDRELFISWIQTHPTQVDFIFHMGARTDTTEFNLDIFQHLNINYTKAIWNACVQFQIPLIYASSAATYGDGSHGYHDDHELIPKLKALNPYGESKQAIDLWILQQKDQPPIWQGFKFFNVFGPNEYHKERMASVVFHGYHQVIKNNCIKLFESNQIDINDGEQMRDFIYIKDVVWGLLFAWKNKIENGIYNLGSGKAISFLTLATAVFESLDLEPNIEFIPMPEDLKNTYQNYTKAEMSKLGGQAWPGIEKNFVYSVEEYVLEYLVPKKVF
ncbi:MAG: ADP-glyceromanno-heptose 6-epimerase [Bacteroidota bacterium]|nr:ADP-glyceromanno-heptose 6-epimerase [Bacteroidota bacterium]